MRRTLKALLVILLAVSVASAQADTAVTDEMRSAANDAYQKADWAAAAAAYEKIIAAEAKNPSARYRLANSLLNLQKPREALPHLEEGLATAPNPYLYYALARAHAKLGDKAKAVEALEGTLKMGGLAPEILKAEKDFAAFQTDAAFIDFVKRSDLVINPCKAAPGFRQFDFWIGEWDVKTTQGFPAGTSSVQLILNQCTIFENWTAANGSQGKSFNIYDKSDGKWHQTWVSDKGVFTHYVGGLVDDKMVVVAETMSGGKKGLSRMSFSRLPNGDVRQHGESSADDGKTWTTTFDLIYTRRK